MPIYSTKWDIALIRNFGGGRGLTVGCMNFNLRNVELGTTNGLVFVSGGFGASLIPISYSKNLKPEFQRVYSTRPTTFEGIDLKGATAWIAAADDGGGLSISYIKLKIFDSLFPSGGLLLLIEITDASLKSKLNKTSDSIPNASLDRHAGFVKVRFRKQDPLDLPDPPDDPVWPNPGPIIPFQPPPPPPPPVRPIRKTLEADILFGFDSTRIRKEAELELYRIVDELEQRSSPRVVIEGHADWTGKEYYNRDLSKRRAEAVKEWLWRAGAPQAFRYQTVGKGEADPVADNRTSEGRAKNRRVEILIS